MSRWQVVARPIKAVVGWAWRPCREVGASLWRPIDVAASWIDKSISGVIRRILSFAERRMALLAGLSLAAVVTVSAVYWHETEQIRNVGLVVAAIIALPVAIWRSRVADQQADIAQQSVLNERYQKSAEMLGSTVLSVRIGGIVALERLALEHPAQYHAEVMKLLFAFIRQPIEDPQARPVPMLDMRGARPDVQAAVDAVRTCRALNRAVEANSIRSLDLRGADLQKADLDSINLSIVPATEVRAFAIGSISIPDNRAVLSHADLSGAKLIHATMPHCLCDETEFADADLSGADLAGAVFLNSNLRDAILLGANLSGAEFYEKPPGAMGLTQRQLDEARADPDAPPKLVDMFDAETGKRLEWRGKECEKSSES